MPKDLRLEESIQTDHHWSGWPGAYCLHCGHEDPMEYAIANDLFDPYTDKWKSEQDRQDFLEASACFTTREVMEKCPQCSVRRQGNDGES